MLKQLKEYVRILIGAAIICAILFGMVSCHLHRFKLYQKKYGSHMTYTDFILDGR